MVQHGIGHVTEYGWEAGCCTVSHLQEGKVRF